MIDVRSELAYFVLVLHFANVWFQLERRFMAIDFEKVEHLLAFERKQASKLKCRADVMMSQRNA